MQIRRPRIVLISSFTILFFSLSPPGWTYSQNQTETKEEALRQEEVEDYYKKWLNEDVAYIITDEEKSVFSKLTTPEEKEQFIEQFWFRRDPDLGTVENEFKEEHYRRIAYANDNYTSGQLGWKTDRGMIYIIHGPPDEIVNRAGGGAYVRPTREGGGTTATYAFEKWWYRHIDGLGDDIELEFVDKSFTDEYELVRTPFDKDMLLHMGMGKTLAEEMGMMSRADHPFFNPGSQDLRDGYPFMEARARDNPFRRYETYALVQKAPNLKYRDLKELVDVNVTYDNLPFQVRQDYFRLNDAQILVPVSIEFQNKELTYWNEGGRYIARIAIYGIVTDLSNKIVTEFEDDVTSSYTPLQLETGRQLRSMYQKILPLEAKGRYKLDLVIKDVRGEKVGVTRQAIVPPKYDAEKLTLSSLIVTDSIRLLDKAPEKDERFVLGDVWMLPILTKSFSPRKPLAVYLQVYGAKLDQSTLEPSLEVSYRLMSGGKTALEVVDAGGESIQYFSSRRIVVIKQLGIDGLEPGEYQLQVEVRDQNDEQTVSVRDRLEVKGISSPAHGAGG